MKIDLGLFKTGADPLLLGMFRLRHVIIYMRKCTVAIKVCL